MHNTILTRPLSSSANAAIAYGSQAVLPAAQGLAGSCSDSQFIALLEAYRPSGGLAPGQEVRARVQRCRPTQVVMLAHWIVHRQVICFDWQSRMWLPLFQFDNLDMTPQPGLDQVLAVLKLEHDAVEVAQWFVQPNPWLSGQTPADTLLSDLPAVLCAAGADARVLRH